MANLIGIYESWQFIFLITALAYFFISYFVGFLVYYLFYNLFKKQSFKIKIQKLYSSEKVISVELRNSFITLFIHITIGGIVIYLSNIGLTKIYSNYQDFSTLYFFISILLMIIIHDSYFYWTHRLMHLPSIYKIVHEVHHRSTNPSPWTAFSLHPLESLIEAGIFPVIAFLIPCHWLSLSIFLTYMIVINVMGHSGFEIYSTRFRQSLVGKSCNTSTHHNVHHQLFKWNYGLYFTFWDKIMKTYKK